MTTGIIRRIDDLGRIVIPKEIRRKLNIKEGDPLELSLDGNKVVFELYIPTYEYKKEINRLIERLEEEKDYLNKEEINRAILKLQEACNVLHGEKESESEENAC